LRSRYEKFDWFDAPNFNDSYGFTGTQLRLSALRSTPRLDIQIDGQGTLLTNLPRNSVAPPPQGALGLGANYFAANGSREGAVYVRQAFVRLKGLSGKGSFARLGRFEFNDGTETVAKNPTLAFLKTQRISQRLIGTFAFSHIGRAFDGAQFSSPTGKTGNFTAVVARPTQGVFQLDGNPEVKGTSFAYGAFTNSKPNSDVRLFGLIYDDTRDPPASVKVDNRPLAARTADNKAIRIYTIGANAIRTIPSRGGTTDLLVWGAVQGGDWGTQKHSANAFSLEAGFQPKGARFRPWLRAGLFRSSGDRNPLDNRHGTFFAPLYTPRLYARFPFFNELNNTDLFSSLILRPNTKTNLRLEYHNLRLTSARDLWYSGGGAFQNTSFGYAGRPSGGKPQLANLVDGSIDFNLDPQTTLSAYYGYAFGGQVIQNIYPNGKNGSYGFLEFSRKF